MAQGIPWTFEQLAGEKRKIALYGWNAPMGRPRQEAVVRPAISIRATRTRYPGGDGSQVTRHVFGPEFPDLELKGRFRRGQVDSILRNMRAFVADAQPVKVAWGNTVVCEGFIKEFDPGIEGANSKGAYEVEWTMRIEVDIYPDLKKRKTVGALRSPGDYTGAIKAAFLKAQTTASKLLFTGDILDLLDAAFESLLGAVNEIASVTDQLSEWKNAALSKLNRVRGAAANVIRAGQQVREFIDSIPVDAARVGASFNALEAMTQTPSVQYQLQQMLKEARDADETAERAIVGRTKTTYIAKDADTWESMSSKFYGNPNRANDIRDANLAAPGAQVRPGQTYLIPE